GQVVEIAAGGELHRLQVELGREAADHDRQVIGRAGCGAERLDLGIEQLEQLVAAQRRRRLLEQEGFVGGAAALGNEQEVIFVAGGGVEVDLRRQVRAGVLLLE